MNLDDIILLLHRFKKMNRDKYGIINIGVFGSTPRGAITEQSDIDIVYVIRYNS